MTTLRRSLLIAVTLLLAIFIVACGTSGTQGTNTGSTGKTTTNAGDMGNNNNAGMMATATALVNVVTTPMVSATMPPQGNMNNGGNMGGDQNAFIRVTQVMLNGKMVNVLMTNKGFLLYYYKNDMIPQSSCTGACAKSWPPLLAQDMMMTVTSSQPLPKKLTVHMTANGNQVEYDGHPLYTYVGDMAPGQFNGRGMDMAWYLVGTQL